MLKPPVWTWEIALYFFVGGLGGMAAVLAAPAWFTGHADVQRTAMWLATVGGVLTPVLLIMDLGRPKLFLHVVRVFKPRSPMSVGSYIVSAFGTFAVPGGLLVELAHRQVFGSTGLLATGLHLLSILFTLGAAFWGMFLANYTGVSSASRRCRRGSPTRCCCRFTLALPGSVRRWRRWSCRASTGSRPWGRSAS